jgi:uncharacterized membrane protein YhaH (DUF805 family)
MQAPITQQPVAQAQAIPQQMMGAVGMATPMAARPAKMMSLQDSVKTCLQKYVNFEGRASRSEFWWFYLAIGIAGLITGIVDGIVFGWGVYDPTWLTWILQIGYFLPFLAACTRRLHDHGKSGWFMLIPFYNLYLFIIDGEGEVNKYGAPPTNVL